MNKREQIAKRVASELKDGDIVNLGIGLPTLVANYIPKGIDVTLQSENGILGLGPTADKMNRNSNIIDAGGTWATVLEGASFFDSVISFGMIRGGHVTVTVLGALEVDQEGNLASWMIPGKKVTGIGGAMDLATGARRVIVAMRHQNKTGESKVLKKCTLPLTALNRVNLIVTDKAVMEVIQGRGLVVREIAPDVSIEELKKATDADLIINNEMKRIEL